MRPRARAAFALASALVLAAPLALAEEVTLQDQGRSLRAELSLADGKTLADGVVVLLHGTLAHNRMEIMQALETAMNDRGYNTLAVNLSYNLDKREGMLDCGVTHTHRHEDAVRELGLWVDWLKGQGAGKLALMGHSRGGNQVSWYALEHDDPAVEAVIAVAPMTWDAKREADGYEARYQQPLAPLYAGAEKRVKAGKGGEVMEKTDLLYCEHAKVSAQSFVSYYRDDWRKDSPQVIAKLKKPVLVLAASEDEAVRDLPERMEGVADGERVKFQVVDGADHFFRDLYAEDVADAVAEYLGW